jgi:putative flippase GtrA
MIGASPDLAKRIETSGRIQAASDAATTTGLTRGGGMRPRRFEWLRSRLERHSQVLRYLVVGGANTFIGYCAFALLNYLLTDLVPYAYMFANVGASVFAITAAFFGYKLFVFKTKGNYLREYLRTYVVYGTSTVLGLALLPMLVALVALVVQNKALVPYVAQAFTIPLVVLTSFFGHKKFSFRS